ncbi:MAG: toxin HicA, partial [Chloroflexota bacterium]
MTKREKLLKNIQANPKSVRFEDVDLLLIQFRFERRQPGKGSSHYVYKLGEHTLVIARHKPFIHVNAVKDV